jgi:vitamin B12 transporter
MPGGGCYVYDATNDGFHDLSGSAFVRYSLNDAADVEASVLRSQGRTRYAGSYTNYEDFADQSSALAGHFAVLPNLKVMLQVGQSTDHALDTLNGVVSAGNQFDTTRHTSTVQADWGMTSNQLITVGVDYLKDQVFSDNAFSQTSRSVTGEFAEYQVFDAHNNLAMSLRSDQNSQFGDHLTGNLAFSHQLSNTLQLMASVGTAFHAPTFDDLYFPQFGNPTLKAETSKSAELGIDQHSEHNRWSLHVFTTQLDNLVEYDAINYTPENIDRAKITGLEYSQSYTFHDWQIAGTASWLNAINDSTLDGNYGKELPRRARFTANLKLTRTVNNVRWSTVLNASGLRYDDLSNLEPLGSFVTVDECVDWKLNSRWLLQAKLANLSNKRYEYALYYPQDGRNFMLTLRYQLKTAP